MKKQSKPDNINGQLWKDKKNTNGVDMLKLLEENGIKTVYDKA